MSLPIRLRLTAWYVTLLAVILAALGAFVFLRLRSDLLAGVDRSLDLRAAQIALGFAGRGEGEFQDVSDASLRGLPRGESAAQLLAPDGTVLETSGDAVASRALLPRGRISAVIAGDRERATVRTGPDREPFRLLAVPIRAGGAPAVVLVATSLEDVQASLHEILILLLLGGPVALLAAAGGGWLLAGRSLGPVAAMTREAASIGPHRLHDRVPVPNRSDELASLAITLNRMLDRIEEGVGRQHRLVADASHELRTPLAIMRTELDVRLLEPDLSESSRTTLESTREEVERMTRIVENLLTLAHIDEGQLSLARGLVDLAGAAEAVRDQLRSLAELKGIRVEVVGSDVRAVTDADRLHQVVTNLLENALKFTEPGGNVVLSAWREGAAVGLTVRDNGPGIAPEALGSIFDRFYRVDSSRARSGGGSGLGLAICREVMEAQGGRVWVESEPGEGTAFSIAWPAPGLAASVTKP